MEHNNITSELACRKLLIVDDQPTNVRGIYELLKGSYRLYMATDGHMALEVARRERPEVILLDVMMPGLDGFEVCRQLKESPETAEIAVIFVTGQNSTEDEMRGLELGAVDFIAKPINPKIVQMRVKTHMMLRAQAEQLRSQALTDALTGLSNRRRFDSQLKLEWRACRRAKQPLGVLLIDVDAFKAYNDHYGHQLGDIALRSVARAIDRALRRPRDFVARYGGEEFACLLPNADHESTWRIAEYLRRAVESDRLPHTHSVAAVVTVSIGCASAVPSADTSPLALIELADRQLYRAKDQGRNRVCI
ncbi:MAG: diguanylate cyclase [Deltaproteobacteria bacterium]|nr:diguanylate cyclase [Deltaproteobacteria bacterium]